MGFSGFKRYRGSFSVGPLLQRLQSYSLVTSRTNFPGNTFEGIIARLCLAYYQDRPKGRFYLRRGGFLPLSGESSTHCRYLGDHTRSPSSMPGSPDRQGRRCSRADFNRSAGPMFPKKRCLASFSATNFAKSISISSSITGMGPGGSSIVTYPGPYLPISTHNYLKIPISTHLRRS